MQLGLRIGSIQVFGKTRFIRPKWVNQNSEAIEAFFEREKLATLGHPDLNPAVNLLMQ